MSSTSQNERILIPESTVWLEMVGDVAKNNMRTYDNCAQSIVAAFMTVFGLDDPLVMRTAGGFMGGMLSSLTCGVHTAGIMTLGMLVGRERMDDGLDGLLPIVLPAQELIRRLNKRFGSHSCLELTGVDFTDLDQAITFRRSTGHEDCVSRVASGAFEIARFITEMNEKGELFRPALLQ